MPQSSMDGEMQLRILRLDQGILAAMRWLNALDDVLTRAEELGAGIPAGNVSEIRTYLEYIVVELDRVDPVRTPEEVYSGSL